MSGASKSVISLGAKSTSGSAAGAGPT